MKILVFIICEESQKIKYWKAEIVEKSEEENIKCLIVHFKNQLVVSVIVMVGWNTVQFCNTRIAVKMKWWWSSSSWTSVQQEWFFQCTVLIHAFWSMLEFFFFTTISRFWWRFQPASKNIKKSPEGSSRSSTIKSLWIWWWWWWVVLLNFVF